MAAELRVQKWAESCVTVERVTTQSPLNAVRDALAGSLFEMIAGPDGPAERVRIHDTPGPRWFPEGSPIRRVHADASMFVGGLRALLLQSLHPLAMAGVAQHSNYRGDPWGRLQRTSTFLAVTTFGAADDAQRAVDKVRGIHRRVHGISSGGQPYRATDPHLLEWVHIAEADSFLRAHQRYGAAPLDQKGRDGYVAEMAVIATKLGVLDPPRTERELAQRLKAFRPELSGSPEARDAARFLSADAAAAVGRSRALRRAGRYRGGDAAAVGAHTAAAAVFPACRDDRRAHRRARLGRRHPVGAARRRLTRALLRGSVLTVDHVDEEPVDAAITGHLRVKRRGENRSLPHRHHVVGGAGQHFHVRPDALHPRRPDEDRVHRFLETRERQITFERVDLSPESVAPHRDIEGFQRNRGAAVGPASSISLASMIMPAHAP